MSELQQSSFDALRAVNSMQISSLRTTREFFNSVTAARPPLFSMPSAVNDMMRLTTSFAFQLFDEQIAFSKRLSIALASTRKAVAAAAPALASTASVEAAAVTTPAGEAPVMDAPVMDAPVIEAVEAPASETPVIETVAEDLQPVLDAAPVAEAEAESHDMETISETFAPHAIEAMRVESAPAKTSRMPAASANAAVKPRKIPTVMSEQRAKPPRKK